MREQRNEVRSKPASFLSFYYFLLSQASDDGCSGATGTFSSFFFFFFCFLCSQLSQRTGSRARRGGPGCVAQSTIFVPSAHTAHATTALRARSSLPPCLFICLPFAPFAFSDLRIDTRLSQLSFANSPPLLAFCSSVADPGGRRRARGRSVLVGVVYLRFSAFL